MQVTGIILTGGKSTRMGTDKALIEIDRETLLSKAINLCQNFCDEILISSNSKDHDINGIKRIQDEIENCGPMGGIYSSLKHATNEWSFILSVDAINVTSDFVEFLSKHKTNFDAVVPVHSKMKEPLIAMYNKNCMDYFKKHLDTRNYKMHHLLESINANFVDAQEWVLKNPEIFHNVNLPTDLPKKK
jgi:molybdopterin-guanine dinucleotide biosynthesis protein A